MQLRATGRRHLETYRVAMDVRSLLCYICCVFAWRLAAAKSVDANENTLAEKNEQEEPEMQLAAGDDSTIVNETVELFRSVSMPTNFSDYDILQVDGLITLEELINVTATEDNAVLAFEASDIDGERPK